MTKREMQRAIAAHGDSRDGAIGTARTHAVAALDERKEFLEKKVLVTNFAVERVDVEAGAARGSGDEEFLDAAFFAEVVDEVPASGTKEHLLVVAETVKEIEDGKAERFIGVEAGGEKNAVRHSTIEDLAGERIAFDAGRGEKTRRREVKDEKEIKEKADPSLRSG